MVKERDKVKEENRGWEREANRTYKDGMFRTLFDDEQKLIELYNGIKGTNYGPDTEVNIVTLENALYMDIKNDISFEIDGKFIVLFEHQSTKCSNMPLRMLVYLGRQIEKKYGERVYIERNITMPKPEFYVFYNGKRDMDEEEIFRLSDHYPEGISHDLRKEDEETGIEIVAKVINIGYTKDREILEKSKTLREYSQFVEYVNEGQSKGMSLKEAIDAAIEIAKAEGILIEFLAKHAGEEVFSMLFTEVTRERYGELREEEGFEKGIEQKAIEDARNLKNKGISEDIIAECTGLPLETVKNL